MKVLLVEDDEVFRAAIKKSLQNKSCDVTDAANGKAAKEVMLLHKFDLVISDIQMPFFSGVDLVEWVKKNYPTPVVLMTGFSQILETKSAYDVGADGFLAKPFKDADLKEVLLKFSKPVPVLEKTATDLDGQYCKISVDDFLTEKETAYDIHIRISATKYIKIAHSGGRITEERVRAYKEKGVHYVYVRKEDFPKIVKFNLHVAKIANKSSQIDPNKKIYFMKHTGELILENVFVNGVNKESFRESKDFLETSMNTLAEDDQIFTVLDVLSNHADFLYAHSLGVSTFAVMIGREMGWTSTPTLFKLAMGGLFHDIGKKEIDKEILEKPRPLLTQKERTMIESHPTRGKEILSALGSIPSEVIAVAYQHHEDVIGQGYPLAVNKSEIHPLSKIIHVANIFCEYAVKHRPDVTPISGPVALETMEKLKAEGLDKDAFSALKKIFHQKSNK